MNIARLHYITQEIVGKSHVELSEEACAAGIDWVQLRVKNQSFEDFLSIAKQVKEICNKYEAKLIINDHVLIAKEVKADGVHLGKTDMSPWKAREILGEKVIIGGTANTIDDIIALNLAEVNYIGLGPYRFTKTKENLSPVLGLEGYARLLSQCNEEQIKIPIIAIGGIVADDIEGIMRAGIHGIAVSSAINFSENKKLTIELLKSKIMEY